MKHYTIKDYVKPEGAPPVWVEHVKRRTKPEEAHTHDCMEIMYIRSGAACCYINNRHYPVLRGDFYVFAPGDTHEFSISGGLSHDTLLFSPGLFEKNELEMLQQNTMFTHWCTPGDLKEKKLSFPLAAAAELDAMFDELAAECQKNSFFSSMLRKALFIRLLLFALDKGTPEGLSGTHNDLQLSALFNFISEHYHEDLSLLRLARAANVSVNYLNEFMQRTIGQGPIEYLTRYRIEQARRLLENSGDTISQIAMDTGFYDASHFIRVFKQCTGITPGEYRKMLKR